MISEERKLIDGFNRFIKEKFYKEINPREKYLAFREENDIESYEYHIKLDSKFSKGVSLRVDSFLNTEVVSYLKEKYSKDCDNVLIDITGKRIYLIEVKKRGAFESCSRHEFEEKEEDTLYFVRYLFWIIGKINEFDTYEIIKIRWKYGNSRRPDRASVKKLGNKGPYQRYKGLENTYKINCLSKIYLDQLFQVTDEI